MHFSDNNGGTMVMFQLAKKISENGYPVKIYHPYGNITTGIYDNYATLEDVNDETIAIYCHIVHNNPLGAKKIVRWIIYGVNDWDYNQYADNEIIYYYLPFCKNNRSTQQLFAGVLSPDVRNRNIQRTNLVCYTVKKGIDYIKNQIRQKTGIFPHSVIFPKSKLTFVKKQTAVLVGEFHGIQESCIDIFNKSKYFFCYDPCSFLVIIALLCGCIVIQDPVDGYSEEEWARSVLGPVKLKGFAYGIENIKYAEATIGDAYGPCMQVVKRADISIKKFLYEMETKTYNLDKCYKYDESPFSIMRNGPKIKL